MPILWGWPFYPSGTLSLQVILLILGTTWFCLWRRGILGSVTSKALKSFGASDSIPFDAGVAGKLGTSKQDAQQRMKLLAAAGVLGPLGLDAGGDRGIRSMERGFRTAFKGEREWNPRIALALLLTGGDTSRAAFSLGLRGGAAARLEQLAGIGQRLGGPVTQASGEWSLEAMLKGSTAEERAVLEGSYPGAKNAIRQYENEVAGRPPLVTGDDLIAAGMRQGPDLGNALRQVREAQLRGTCATRAEAFAMLQLPDIDGP